jgi:phosphoglycolate phosphatase-like HAD superfamily hydrolase
VINLVLWDIDGTLVDVHGSGRRSFSIAIERTWGVVDDLSDVRFAGATDLGVLAQLRTRLALDAARVPAFFEALPAALAELLAEAPGVAPAGALDVVEALAERADVVQGLVTGNARATARLKLASAGHRPERFVVGGFGDEDADRDVLARRAVERARVLPALALRPHHDVRVVLVGDTPSDVRAARAVGGLAVGVSPSPEGRDALRAAAADHVLEHLVDALPVIVPPSQPLPP